MEIHLLFMRENFTTRCGKFCGQSCSHNVSSPLQGLSMCGNIERGKAKCSIAPPPSTSLTMAWFWLTSKQTLQGNVNCEENKEPEDTDFYQSNLCVDIFSMPTLPPSKLKLLSSRFTVAWFYLNCGRINSNGFYGKKIGWFLLRTSFGRKTRVHHNDWKRKWLIGGSVPLWALMQNFEKWVLLVWK